MMEQVDPSRAEDHVLARRREDFDTSEFACLLGLNVAEARDGDARVCMPASGKRNPDGVIHGGAVFTLADHAFGMASYTGSANRVAVSVSIQYIPPATGDLEARAECSAHSGRYSYYRVLVYERSWLIAAFDGVALQVSL